MPLTFCLLGAVFGLLAVAFGAFGAHSLKAIIAADMLGAFETGARYQMYHALALLAVGWIGLSSPTKWFRCSGWLFVVGIVLFSGSLYVLALTQSRWLGAVTPLGGVALMLGWTSLAVGLWNTKADRGDC